MENVNDDIYMNHKIIKFNYDPSDAIKWLRKTYGDHSIQTRKTRIRSITIEEQNIQTTSLAISRKTIKKYHEAKLAPQKKQQKKQHT